MLEVTMRSMRIPMSDSERLIHCIFCDKKTPHTVSGSGHKRCCQECETSTEVGYEE